MMFRTAPLLMLRVPMFRANPEVPAKSITELLVILSVVMEVLPLITKVVPPPRLTEVNDSAAPNFTVPPPNTVKFVAVIVELKVRFVPDAALSAAPDVIVRAPLMVGEPS